MIAALITAIHHGSPFEPADKTRFGRVTASALRSRKISNPLARSLRSSR